MIVGVCSTVSPERRLRVYDGVDRPVEVALRLLPPHPAAPSPPDGAAGARHHLHQPGHVLRQQLVQLLQVLPVHLPELGPVRAGEPVPHVPDVREVTGGDVVLVLDLGEDGVQLVDQLLLLAVAA